ncbi:MAG: hypothetical protein ABI761_19325, partial [Saprospiraceae bacterium]
MAGLGVENEKKKWLMTMWIITLVMSGLWAKTNKLVPGNPIPLFTIDQAQEFAWKSLRSNKDVRIFTYDPSFYQKIKIEKPAVLNLIIPSIDGDLEVELIENKVLSEDFVLSSDKQRNLAYTPGRFYKGKVKGNESSIVAISLFDDEVFGLITRPGQSNVV